MVNSRQRIWEIDDRYSHDVQSTYVGSDKRVQLAARTEVPGLAIVGGIDGDGYILDAIYIDPNQIAWDRAVVPV